MSAGAEPTSPARMRAAVAVVATGIFVTGFGWPGSIGRLPFGLLLKNQLGASAADVANFWAIATLAYYIKPLVGLICDAYPLAGTRRKGYMLIGAVVAGACWLSFTVAPRAYLPFLTILTALNLALVFVGTAVGGLQIETSQRYHATGRLASLASGLEGVMYVLAGLMGGWLAARAFGWTALTGALTVFGFVPVVAWLHKEHRVARPERAVWTTAGAQIRTIVRSRPMWVAAALLFLVHLAPGLQTPLFYHQTDVLKFGPGRIGVLHALGGLGVLSGAAIYAVVCKHVALRTSLVAGITLNAASTLFYLRYDSFIAAVLIDTTVAMLGTLSLLPLYDLAARATPHGSESFGFGLMISIRNVAIFAISDPVGSWLYSQHHVGFKQLVWISAASTLIVLLLVPTVPKPLLAAREQPNPE